MIKNLLVFLTSLLLTLIFAELSFRGLEYLHVIPAFGSPAIPPDPGSRKYTAEFIKHDNPHMVYRFDPQDKRVNAQGFRDSDFSVEREAGEYRIAVLGDSVTFGFGIPKDKGFVDLLEADLSANTSRKINVMNFGVMGYDSKAEVENYKEFVKPYHPDLLLVAFVLNDTMTPRTLVEIGQENKKAENNNSSNIAQLLKYSHLFVWIEHTLSKGDQKNMVDAIYHLSYEDGNQNWIRVTNAVAELANLAKTDDVKIAAVIFPLLDDFEHYQFTREHKKVAALFNEQHIPTLDLLGAFSRNSYLDYFRHPSDTTHPNELGHQIAASAIAEFLENQSLVPQ